jgi:hypothetical protein
MGNLSTRGALRRSFKELGWLEGVGENAGGTVTRLERRRGVAIAFMAAVLWIMLLIAAWEYLF